MDLELENKCEIYNNGHPNGFHTPWMAPSSLFSTPLLKPFRDSCLQRGLHQWFSTYPLGILPKAVSALFSVSERFPLFVIFN